jgi:hypothetical protein
LLLLLLLLLLTVTTTNKQTNKQTSCWNSSHCQKLEKKYWNAPAAAAAVAVRTQD